MGMPTQEGGGLSVRTNQRGETELEIVGDVLFAPGKATLKPASLKSLDKAVAILKSKFAGRRLRVEGHTDPTPVGKSGWDDNYDLGAARARAVLLYLKAHGITEKSMYIASFGANDLRSTKNLALDRRALILWWCKSKLIYEALLKKRAWHKRLRPITAKRGFIVSRPYSFLSGIFPGK